jgi:hypothetical protein
LYWLSHAPLMRPDWRFLDQSTCRQRWAGGKDLRRLGASQRVRQSYHWPSYGGGQTTPTPPSNGLGTGLFHAARRCQNRAGGAIASLSLSQVLKICYQTASTRIMPRSWPSGRVGPRGWAMAPWAVNNWRAGRSHRGRPRSGMRQPRRDEVWSQRAITDRCSRVAPFDAVHSRLLATWQTEPRQTTKRRSFNGEKDSVLGRHHGRLPDWSADACQSQHLAWMASALIRTRSRAVQHRLPITAGI